MISCGRVFDFSERFELITRDEFFHLGFLKVFIQMDLIFKPLSKVFEMRHFFKNIRKNCV